MWEIVLVMKPIFLSYCPTIDVADLQRWQFLTIKSRHFLHLSRNSLDQLTSHLLIAIVGANVIWRVILISTMMANLTAVIQCPPMIKFFSFYQSLFFLCFTFWRFELCLLYWIFLQGLIELLNILRELCNSRQSGSFPAFLTPLPWLRWFRWLP